jgi:hypothetical protein
MSISNHASRRNRAYKKITELDLNQVVIMAKNHFKLTDEEVGTAIQDYRNFLFLVFCNWQEKNFQPVIPTILGDKLWHGHLLLNKTYNQFCNKLFGRVLHHNPDFENNPIPKNNNSGCSTE